MLIGPVTAGMRSMENFTSSAVSSDPSWNFTPSRILNSQVVSSMGFQDVARPGFSCRFSSAITTVSKMWRRVSAWLPRVDQWGSMESGPARTPMVRVWACADAPSGAPRIVPNSSAAARVGPVMEMGFT